MLSCTHTYTPNLSQYSAQIIIFARKPFLSNKKTHWKLSWLQSKICLSNHQSVAFYFSIREQRQSISYCGVNAHHQNRRRKKFETCKFKEEWCWFTPYINGRRSKDGKVPLPFPPRLYTLHPFGCPVYVLENELQQGNKMGKWEKIGVEWACIWALHVHMLDLCIIYCRSKQDWSHPNFT